MLDDLDAPDFDAINVTAACPSSAICAELIYSSMQCTPHSAECIHTFLLLSAPSSCLWLCDNRMNVQHVQELLKEDDVFIPTTTSGKRLLELIDSFIYAVNAKVPQLCSRCKASRQTARTVICNCKSETLRRA